MLKIGIIGAGHIGGTLTRRLADLGHDVFVANSRGPASLAELAAETGATAVDVEEAARAGRLVIVTIPEGRVRDLPKDLFRDAQEDLVVVDTGNYYPERDGTIAEIEAGLPESRWVGLQLGHDVVKAFNSMHAEHLLKLGRPAGSIDRLAIPIAGDDGSDKRLVLRLVDELGFDGVDAGSIDESWRQQPGTPVYGADLDANGVRRALAEAVNARGPRRGHDVQSRRAASG